MSTEPRTCFFTGDIGDVIAALPIVRAMGGASIRIGPPPPEAGSGPGFCRQSLEGARFESLRPLLEAQPYVHGVEWGERQDSDVDFSTFRYTSRLPGENLISWQARHVGWYNIDSSQWLHVPNPEPSPVIFARSPRYHNGRTPWHAYCEKHPDAWFVGTESEHKAFERYVGRSVAYRRTDTLLDLARVIAGTSKMIANQSAPWWIAAGLNVPMLIQESSPDWTVQNSVIARDGFWYTGNMEQRSRKNWL